MPISDDRKVRRLVERVAPAEAGGAIHQVIPQERLVHHPWAAPVRRDAESMAKLREQIFTYGVREPLLGRRLPDDMYQILVGGDCLEAAREAGKRTLPVLVIDLPEETAIGIALADAFIRERISPWETAQELAEFVHSIVSLGLSADTERVATLLDHSPEWVEQMRRIAERLTPAVLRSANVSVYDLNELTENELLDAAEPSTEVLRAQRLRKELDRRRFSRVEGTPESSQ